MKKVSLSLRDDVVLAIDDKMEREGLTNKSELYERLIRKGIAAEDAEM